MRYFISQNRFLILIFFSVCSFAPRLKETQTTISTQEGTTRFVINDSLPKDVHDSSSQMAVPADADADYPGGEQGWTKYLSQHLHYPDEAVNNEIQGNVDVKFFIDKDGNISNIKAISGPNALRGESVRVVQESGKWIPARKNGQNVDSYKLKTMKFRIEVGK
ncbi:MAG: hypothetical protein C5B59_16530 [Bacteroidetes bacterium]|nr:MAG: hypothetical protein C5B59_16530 [Bacteroidota bacterium]